MARAPSSAAVTRAKVFVGSRGEVFDVSQSEVFSKGSEMLVAQRTSACTLTISSCFEDECHAETRFDVDLIEGGVG
jgi:hypothetical protein